MKRFLVITALIFLIGLFVHVKPAYAGYACAPRAECLSEDGAQVVGDSLCGGCTSPDICCYVPESGLKGWEHIIWGSSGPPDTFKILGMDLETSAVRNMIKSLFAIATSLFVISLLAIAVYGGVLRTMAGDSEEQLQKSKKTMNGIIAAVGITFGFMAVLGFLAWLFGVNIFDFSFLDEVLGT